jgi:hypothetical protein
MVLVPKNIWTYFYTLNIIKHCTAQPAAKQPAENQPTNEIVGRESGWLYMYNQLASRPVALRLLM